MVGQSGPGTDKSYLVPAQRFGTENRQLKMRSQVRGVDDIGAELSLSCIAVSPTEQFSEQDCLFLALTVSPIELCYVVAAVLYGGTHCWSTHRLCMRHSDCFVLHDIVLHCTVRNVLYVTLTSFSRLASRCNALSCVTFPRYQLNCTVLPSWQQAAERCRAVLSLAECSRDAILYCTALWCTALHDKETL